MAQPSFAYRSSVGPGGQWEATPQSPGYRDSYQSASFVGGSHRPSSATYNNGPSASFGHAPAGHMARPDPHQDSSPVYGSRPPSGTYGSTGISCGSYTGTVSSVSWEAPSKFSPSDSLDDIVGSSGLSDYSSIENVTGTTSPGRSAKHSHAKGRAQRRPSNRDEFDGPHQFLQQPPADYIALQERELPHLPTNLLVQEQDSVLARVNDRLSLCAFDFVAKYQFPIPLTQDMRPVERPQDREWTEWVYLLKRLATKRRIPARVLYNGQIKQFVTILENSLEMRHAAKHQSRPLKDDRNILQLISAGIQVAKILKDAQAMDYLDRLYISTEQQIQDRSARGAARFRG